MNILKGYSKTNQKIEVIHKDFFEYDLNISKTDESVILCNPPFTGRLNDKNETHFWVYFVIKILESMHNIHSQSAYFVLPKSNLFRRGSETLKYVESEIGHQCGLIMPSSLEKKIINILVLSMKVMCLLKTTSYI